MLTRLGMRTLLLPLCMQCWSWACTDDASARTDSCSVLLHSCRAGVRTPQPTMTHSTSTQGSSAHTHSHTQSHAQSHTVTHTVTHKQTNTHTQKKTNCLSCTAPHPQPPWGRVRGQSRRMCVLCMSVTNTVLPLLLTRFSTVLHCPAAALRSSTWTGSMGTPTSSLPTRCATPTLCASTPKSAVA